MRNVLSASRRTFTRHLHCMRPWHCIDVVSFGLWNTFAKIGSKTTLRVDVISIMGHISWISVPLTSLNQFMACVLKKEFCLPNDFCLNCPDQYWKPIKSPTRVHCFRMHLTQALNSWLQFILWKRSIRLLIRTKCQDHSQHSDVLLLHCAEILDWVVGFNVSWAKPKKTSDAHFVDQTGKYVCDARNTRQVENF